MCSVAAEFFLSIMKHFKDREKKKVDRGKKFFVVDWLMVLEGWKEAQGQK